MTQVPCDKCGNTAEYMCSKCERNFCSACCVYDKKGNPHCPDCNAEAYPLTEEQSEEADQI